MAGDVPPAAGGPDTPGRDQGIYTTFAFISSSLSELRQEREALDRGLSAVRPHFYDHEHGAAFESHQDEWRYDLTRCHIYIGIFWKKLGPWTLDEFEVAKAASMPMLLYFKGPFEWDGRSDELVQLIESLGDVDRQGAAFFEELPDDFAAKVDADLEREKSKAFAASIERRRILQTEEGRTYTPTPDGGRVDDAAEAPPAAARRAAVGRLDPFPPDEFIDREEVLEELLDLLDEEADDELIELIGPKGMGKGSILERLAAEDLTERFPEGVGVNPAGARRDDLDDLLWAVFDAFYESSDQEVAAKWSSETLRAHMAGTHEGTEEIAALVVFEDVPPGSEQFVALRSALPKSVAVCVTAEEDTGEGVDVPVEGFGDDDDVLKLFAARYGSPVPEKAAEHVLAACRLLGNAPGSIRDLGRLAKREAKPQPGLEPLVAWARAKAESPPDEVLERGGRAKEAVKALVAAGGEAPAEVVGRVAGAAATGDALADGAIEPGSPRYRLARPVPTDVAGASGDVALMGAILDSAVEWAETARLDEIRDDRAFVERIAQWGVVHQRYDEVLRLARAADPALAMGIRWGAWERLLLSALEAAIAKGDRCSEAWARHQLGTRALLLGRQSAAHSYLSEALRLRRLHCVMAVPVTEHNLGMVDRPPPAPLVPPPLPGSPVDHAPRPPAPKVRRPPRPAPTPPRVGPLPKLVPPGIAVVVLLLVWLWGPRGGIADFEVPFGAVPVTEGEQALTLFRLAPDEYANDRGEPLTIAVALAGDTEFCLAVAGIGAAEGECRLRPGQAAAGLGRAPPWLAPVPGMPLAQGAAEGCSLAAAPDGEGAVLSILPGGVCPLLFGFDPPAQPGLSRGAVATFETDDGRRWKGRLSGSTVGGAEGPLRTTKTVDADRDGEFQTTERHASGALDAEFAVVVENVGEATITLDELADNRYGDVTALPATSCATGVAIEPGESYSCRYEGEVAGEPGGRFENIVTATVDLDGELFSAAGSAAVEFDDGRLVVSKEVDADGDGSFATSERFPATGPGPVEFRVTVENRAGEDLTLLNLTDTTFGDLTTLGATTCATGVAIAAGETYRCGFTATIDPTVGPVHRNTVEVTVDPALDSPYKASAEVTFGVPVTVTKTVDANGDGEFSSAESISLPATGQAATFHVQVRNLGPEPVELVALTDSVFGDLAELDDSTCATGLTIAPGGTADCEFRADLDGATLHEDTVTALIAVGGDRQEVESNVVRVVPVGGPTTLATLRVDADGDGVFAPAEEAVEGGPRRVAYRITVEQLPGGAVTLGAFSVSPFGDVAAAGDCVPGTQVGPGETYECDFGVDVGRNAGEEIEAVLDTAAWRVEPLGNAATVRFVDALPALSLEVDGPATAAPGERVTLDVRVTNESVATDPVTLAAFADGRGQPLVASTCEPVTLAAPGGFVDCTVAVEVTATAGAPQTFTVVATGEDDEANGVEARDTHTLQVLAPADVSIVKSLAGNADEDGTGTVSAGDTLTFRFAVANTGTEPLTAVRVDDSLTGFSGTCNSPPVLAAGDTTTCTTTYRVTAVDAAAGQVRNRADASATAPSGAVADFDIVVVPVPGILLDMSVVRPHDDRDGSGTVTAGDVLTYRYGVSVTTRFARVTVSSDLPGLGPIGCSPANGSPVSALMSCTADYTVTAADAAAGVVVNTGVARGVVAGGQVLTATDRVEVPVSGDGAPDLGPILDATPEAVSLSAGQPSRTVTVSNIGTAAFRMGTVTAPPGFTVTNGCNGAMVNPGGSCTFQVGLAGGGPAAGMIELPRSPFGAGDSRVLVSRP